MVVVAIVSNDASGQRDKCEEMSESVHDVLTISALGVGSKLKRRPQLLTASSAGRNEAISCKPIGTLEITHVLPHDRHQKHAGKGTCKWNCFLGVAGIGQNIET